MKIKVSRYVGEQLDGLRKKDFKIQPFKSSGPGGQHRNKNATAIRITHKATGITAEASDAKSQARNRSNAFVKLVKKLIAHYGTQGQAVSFREEQNEGTIRTYNAMRHTVKDHRTGVTAKFKDVMDGEIDCFLK